MNLFVVLLLIFSAAPIAPDQQTVRKFIIWNVGQGQWATWVQGDECHHFDMGGEVAPWRKITSLCSEQKNFLYFSHWDWDHVGFSKGVQRHLPEVCVAQMPLGSTTAKKRRLLSGFNHCLGGGAVQIVRASRFRTPNQGSNVFYLREPRLLIPGDSPISEERRWLSLIHGAVEAIVLGHHGSRTSTGSELLSRLSPRWAVASARERRYGHPHKEIIRELQRRRIPLLRTEDWGHLIFEY